MILEVEEFGQGNAQRLKETVKRLEKVLKEAQAKGMQAAAERFLQGLKENWEGQRAILWPLSQAYREAKQKKGLDARILIATRELLDSLQIIKQKDALVVGAPPGRKHSDSNLKLEELLKVIEYGSPSRNLPSRAILRQTKAALREELARVAKEEIFKVVKEAMQG